MTDTKALKERIASSGLKLTYLSEQMGITRQTFNNKINNRTDFSVCEQAALCKLLHINAKDRRAIFLP